MFRLQTRQGGGNLLQAGGWKDQGSCLCLLGLEGSKLCPMSRCSPRPGGWGGPAWLCNELLLH